MKMGMNLLSVVCRPQVHKKNYLSLFAVFRIRYFLLRIRMRIRILRFDQRIRIRILLSSSVTFKRPTKKSFFPMFLCFLQVYLHHSSQKKIHKDVTKQQKSRFFFIFLLVDGRIRIRIRTNKLQIRILFQQKYLVTK